MRNVNILTSSGVNIEKSLEIFGDMNTYDESLGDFLGEIYKKLSEIQKFKETSDMANYAILVHSLKSDANYFGFEKLAELSYKHEMESKAKNVAYIYDNYDDLVAEANRIIGVVKAYTNGGTLPQAAVIEEIEVLNLSPAKEKAIIVVDDSNLVINYLRKVFANDFEVLVANNGDAAINIMETHLNQKKIAGMLLDLNMPGSDGFAVLEYLHIHSLFPVVPVAIITGNDVSEVDRRAFGYPIVDMIKKPFNERDIKLIVDKILMFSGQQ